MSVYEYCCSRDKLQHSIAVALSCSSLALCDGHLESCLAKPVIGHLWCAFQPSSSQLRSDERAEALNLQARFQQQVQQLGVAFEG